MWFEKITGFQEESPQKIREKLKIDGDAFISTLNNRRITFGELEVATLEDLRRNSPSIEGFRDHIQLKEIVADVQQLHLLPENAKALFQAASQFNLLEMIGPNISPEQGIDRYERDHTQGPACAIACGAGTIFRNYFVAVGDQIGQTEDNQIDCLDLIGKELENDQLKLWSMKNGYALVKETGLVAINKKLALLTTEARENLKGKLKVGIQWNTEVTLSPNKHKVTQIYCSALPVAYCQTESIYWEGFARLILEATYEATLFTALNNLRKNNSNVVYLTLVGGGAFGNEENWILESLQKALYKFRTVPLDVRIVSYGQSNLNLRKMLEEFK